MSMVTPSKRIELLSGKLEHLYFSTYSDYILLHCGPSCGILVKIFVVIVIPKQSIVAGLWNFKELEEPVSRNESFMNFNHI